ncbi:predicted protein [Histoplasma capsulatum var. duboisii H88]|uniref:Predicted protein n=2 Tax=Ajellomyces capsulatus TaxID=5037 RepID=F0U973_AJEC8|nr:predicted protein [Histoplasma capsulatum H143]EGC41023.1 predicted protein [Histoplasma capsulatum var. duboisii H88]
MAAQAVRIGTIVVRTKTRARFRSDDKESRARKRMWSPRDPEAAEVRRDGHRNPAEEEVWGLGHAAWRPVSWPEFGQVGGLAPNPGIRITRRELAEGGKKGKGKEWERQCHPRPECQLGRILAGFGSVAGVKLLVLATI